MKQWQWMPSDAGQWHDIPEEGNDAEFEVIMKLRGPRGQAEGAQARFRDVGGWQPYTLPARPEDVIDGLKDWLTKQIEAAPESVVAKSLHLVEARMYELEHGR